MRDIRGAALYVKAALFAAIGVVSAMLILLRTPRISSALLIGLAIWAFARLYYFAFYVIERYVDPAYRFSGLWSCGVYLWRKRRSAAESAIARERR